MLLRLLALAVSALLPVAASAAEPFRCDLSGLMGEVRLAEIFTSPTRSLRDPAVRARYEPLLPLGHPQRLLRDTTGRYTALFGWAGFADSAAFSHERSLEVFPRDQVRSRFETLLEGHEKDFGPTAAGTVRFEDQGFPFTIHTDLQFTEGGRPMRMRGMDLLPRADCLFSVRFIGPAADPDSAVMWSRVEAELALMRQRVPDQAYPVVAFAGEVVRDPYYLDPYDYEHRPRPRTVTIYEVRGFLDRATPVVAGLVLLWILAFGRRRRRAA